MRLKMLRSVVFTVAIVAAGTLYAQFGHPLKGSWSGDWGVDENRRTRVLVNLDWDGKAITGAINPGPNAATVTQAVFDPATWSVRLEAEAKDAAGKVVVFAIDGKLENVGVYRRFITGTWTEDGVKGDFRIDLN